MELFLYIPVLHKQYLCLYQQSQCNYIEKLLCISTDWQQWQLVQILIPLLKYCSDIKNTALGFKTQLMWAESFSNRYDLYFSVFCDYDNFDKIIISSEQDFLKFREITYDWLNTCQIIYGPCFQKKLYDLITIITENLCLML